MTTIRDRLFCATEGGGDAVTQACQAALADARSRQWQPPRPPAPGIVDGPWPAGILAVLLVFALLAVLVLAVRRPAVQQ